MDYFVHDSAIVDDGASVGQGTRIWHFSHVMSKAVVGPRCSLGQNVFIADHAQLGEGVKVQNNVSIYEGVVLEDFVFCGPSMVFTNVRAPRAKFPTNNEGYDETRVGEGASIGANATIVCGVQIGPWAFIGAGAVITKDVPAFALMVGVPARQVGWACGCGRKLTTHEGAALCSCNRSYKESEAGSLEFVNGPAL
jgi:UDP-2-acetamido-3-amino-2,3-dideoxy-glucuronate N-acetyltransferase